MESPIYHLTGVIKAKETDMADFVGPLDLILHLLSKNKMEIRDIQLSLILAQYITWMNTRKELDLDIASDFVATASHLIFIKTRMLLSIHDEEALSEMEQLMAPLEAHQRNENLMKIRAILPELRQRHQYGQNFITKEPESFAPKRTYHYTHETQDLLRAMSAILERVDHKMPPSVEAFHGIVGREPYPVEDKISEVLRRLIHAGVTGFRSLFRGNRSRSEIVATFLAVLELCKSNCLHLAGTESECTVTCTDGETREPATQINEN